MVLLSVAPVSSPASPNAPLSVSSPSTFNMPVPSYVLHVPAAIIQSSHSWRQSDGTLARRRRCVDTWYEELGHGDM
jgi:hypothetical protein